MRATTKWAIGGYIGWFVANIIASASAPSDLPGFDALSQQRFEDQIISANFWQGIGGLLFIMAIICTIVTLYKNIMDKNINKTVHGDEITATNGSTVATRGSSVAQGASTIVNSHIIDSKVSDALSKISSMAEQAALSERDKRSLDLISEKLTSDPPPIGDEKESYLDDILDIFKGSGHAFEGVAKLVSALR